MADLDTFWAGYEPTARRYAWHRLDLHQIPPATLDVDDVTSQAYIELRQNWLVVRNPKAYTKSKVRAAVYAALRTEKRRGASLDATSADDLDDAGGHPIRFDVPIRSLTAEEALVERETEAGLSEALPEVMDELSAQQRQAVDLCDAQGRPRREVAAAMGGITVGAVNAHRARGLAKLRERLRPIAVGMIAAAAHLVLWLGFRALPEPVRGVIEAVFMVLGYVLVGALALVALLWLVVGVLWVVDRLRGWWSDSGW
jgi:RNA polymerase sigma factor (sigma-70 family)